MIYDLKNLSGRELKIILGGLIIRMETGAHADDDVKKITKDLINKIEDTLYNS